LDFIFIVIVIIEFYEKNFNLQIINYKSFKYILLIVLQNSKINKI